MLAAVQGLTDAEGLVGQAYKDGVGVDVDLDGAERWFARAAAKGHELSRKELNEIRDAEAAEALATVKTAILHSDRP